MLFCAAIAIPAAFFDFPAGLTAFAACMTAHAAFQCRDILHIHLSSVRTPPAP